MQCIIAAGRKGGQALYLIWLGLRQQRAKALPTGSSQEVSDSHRFAAQGGALSETHHGLPSRPHHAPQTCPLAGVLYDSVDEQGAQERFKQGGRPSPVCRPLRSTR